MMQLHIYILICSVHVQGNMQASNKCCNSFETKPYVELTARANTLCPSYFRLSGQRHFQETWHFQFFNSYFQNFLSCTQNCLCWNSWKYQMNPAGFTNIKLWFSPKRISAKKQPSFNPKQNITVAGRSSWKEYPHPPGYRLARKQDLSRCVTTATEQALPAEPFSIPISFCSGRPWNELFPSLLF